MASNATFDIVGVARRGWWIVLIAVVAGAVVTAAATLGAKTTYTGKTYLAVNPMAISSYAQMPKPDVIISESGSADFISDVADRLDLKPDQVKGAFKVFTTGNPQTKLFVTYTSADRALAEKGADAVAEELVLLKTKLADSLVGTFRDSVAADERALASLPPATDPASRFYRWSMEKALLGDTGQLEFAESAYVYKAPVAVATSSRRTAVLTAAVGGALAGLFLGIVLVAIREYLRYRRTPAASA